jgi:uncharacterized membrane protein YccF (DUF307 family)
LAGRSGVWEAYRGVRVVLNLIRLVFCITIIGIPLGLANFKLIPVTFRPFGRDIVSIEEAERRGVDQLAAVPMHPTRQAAPGS